MLSASDILETKARLCKEKGQKYFRLCKKYQELTEFYFKKSDLFLDCVYALKEIQVKEDENSCPICYLNYKMYVHGSCDHKVCIDCYSKFKSKEKCPLCRESFSNVLEKGINEFPCYKETMGHEEEYMEQDIQQGIEQGIERGIERERSIERPIERPIELQPPIFIYNRNLIQRGRGEEEIQEILQNHEQQLHAAQLNATFLYNPEEILPQYD
jgi:hypothetical protein